MTVTKDGRVAYLADWRDGLCKMDLSTRQISVVSAARIPMRLAVTPDERFLYVNYQLSGPGGRAGHDVIGKFDVRTGKLLRAITGLPNVGDWIAISPDGRTLWVSGGDACLSRAYDHIGCPAVPAGVINIIDIATDRLMRSLQLVGMPGAIAFSPDGTLVAVNGPGARLVDARTFKTVAATPEIYTQALVFCRDGRRAYATDRQRSRRPRHHPALEDFQNQALQIERFRHGQQYRVIR